MSNPSPLSARGRKKIVDNRGQIRQVFHNLHKHFEVLADALNGAIESHDKERATAIHELSAIHALLPYGEASYHLNPHLRHYLKDHLNIYQAFESLTRISPLIHQAKFHWAELCNLQQHGDIEDAEQVEDSLDHLVTSLIHSNERNVQLLTAMVSSEYGNVTSLRAKISQNHYYRTQVIQLLQELISVEALLNLVNERQQDSGEVVQRARQMLNVRLTTRRSTWVNRLNDVQAIISRKLFLARKLAQQLFALSQAALWLSRNPTSDGLVIEPAADTPAAILDALCKPARIRVRPQIDFHDRASSTEEILLRAIQRLPAPAAVTEKEDHGVQRVHALENDKAHDDRSPADVLITELVQHLTHAPAANKVSLLAWQKEQRQIADIEDEIWVLYASHQLALYPNVVLDYHIAPATGGYPNEHLLDVRVGVDLTAH